MLPQDQVETTTGEAYGFPRLRLMPDLSGVWLGCLRLGAGLQPGAKPRQAFGMTDFGSNPDEIVRGMTRALAGLSLSTGQSQRLLATFSEFARSGDPRHQRLVIRSILADEAWEWPDLARWRQTFKVARVWPLLWAQFRFDAATDVTTWPLAEREELLTRHLLHAVFAARDQAQFERECMSDVFGLSLVRGDMRCPADAWIVAKFKARIVAGDLSEYPPFFPGDMSRLRPYVRGRENPDGSRISH